jgi:hypothetical protein
MLRWLLTFSLLCCFGTQTFATPPPLRVEAAFRSVTLRGYSRAIVSATIAAEVPGRIEQVNYAVGDTITTQPIVKIDSTFIDLELENNQLALASNKIAQQQAQVRLAWLQNEFDRRAELVDQGRISQVAFEDISQQRDQAALEVQQQAQQQQQLELQRRVLQQKQQRHQPHASPGWKVSARHVEQDDLVPEGGPLMQVGNYQQLLVPLSVTALELKALRTRNSASLAGQTIGYRIHTVSPAFDETTRKIAIELEIIDYNGEQRGGLPFQLTLKLADDGLMVPLAAVRNHYQHPQVMIVDSENPIAINIVANVQDETGEWVHISANKQLPIGTLLTSGSGIKP